MARALVVAVLLASSGVAHGQRSVRDPTEGAALLGTRAPELRGLRWLQGGPLTLAALRGKLVLIRFWTDQCPLCARTAPALRALDARYRDRGLVVVAVHHPKSRSSSAERGVRELGLTFPVASDRDWQTVRAYGVGTTFKRFTSVSFLVDREGVIRFVHDGGEFHDGGGPGHEDCQAAYDALVEEIEARL